MNKLIKKQLENLRSVRVNFDNNTTNIVIPRTKQIIAEALNKGDIYLIGLDDYLLQPPSNSTLASNWNMGRVPTHKIYKVELLEVMGTMYKFNGIAVENGKDLYTEDWNGWLPKEHFNVIDKL